MSETTKEYELNRLMRMRHQELSKTQLLETIKTTQVITRVEMILAVVLILSNLAIMGYWYQFTQYTLTTFLGWYLTVGTVCNIAVILVHSTWENKYVTKRAAEVMNKIYLIKMDYSGKIKQLELASE